MIAVDTNVLVAASRDDAPGYALARLAIARVAESPDPWAIPWPCVHEFLAVVTHPRIFDPPTGLELALDQVDAWVESPSLVVLAETVNYWPQLRTVLVASQVIGPRCTTQGLPRCVWYMGSRSSGRRTAIFRGSLL